MSPASDLDYAEATRDHHERIRELINLVQPHVPWSHDDFAWQYLTNPAGEARIWIALSGEQVVANYVAVPHRIWVTSYEATAWMIQDVLTHPDFRGRGVMHHLADRCAEALLTAEHPLNYTFPNEFSHQSFIRRGWKAAFRVPLRKLSLDAATMPDTGDGRHPEATSVTAFGKPFDRLWESARTRFDYAVCRDAAYLDWRYLQRPGVEYFPLALTRSGEVQGLLVMKIFETDSGERIAHICDLLASPAAEGASAALMHKALHFGIDMGAHLMTAWLPPGHPDERCYDDAGFVLDNTLSRWVVIHTEATRVSPVEAARPGRWHLTMGDSDVY